MKVKLWGARGSLPTPKTPSEVRDRVTMVLKGFLDAGYTDVKEVEPYLDNLTPSVLGGFGGNTACVQVSEGASSIIIDGGSGIRLLGSDLMKGPCAHGKGEIHIFFTHFHWDHLIGLPFFTPLFIAGNQIHVYSVQPELNKIFETIFKRPFFPVNLDQIASDIHYHTLEPRQPLKVGELTVTPYELDHPDPCWGYRVEGGGKAFAHCVDTEGTRASRADLGSDLPLYQNVDLMIYDAQYTLKEAIEKVNWGHAAATIGLDIAMRERIKRVLFMHHDPASSDAKIALVEQQTRRYYEGQLKSAEKASPPLGVHPVEWCFAQEGIVIDL